LPLFGFDKWFWFSSSSMSMSAIASAMSLALYLGLFRSLCVLTTKGGEGSKASSFFNFLCENARDGARQILGVIFCF
jgi:hypothetical protein